MRTQKEIVDILSKRHPGKNIVLLPKDNPTEIICEVDPTSEHSDYSVAIVVIKSSVSHYHQRAIEVYEVLDGELRITVGGKTKLLKKDENCTVKALEVHSATGDFAIVKVTSKPGWTPDDHILES